MSVSDAKRSAQIAASQATEAASILQRRGIVTDEQRYQENLALAVANLAIAVRQLAEAGR